MMLRSTDLPGVPGLQQCSLSQDLSRRYPVLVTLLILRGANYWRTVRLPPISVSNVILTMYRRRMNGLEVVQLTNPHSSISMLRQRP